MTEPTPVPVKCSTCSLTGGRGMILWGLLVVGLLALQWPLVRGWFGAAAPVEGPGSIAWRTDFDAALAESQQTGKPLLIDFTAEWCPPCKVMKRDVWPDSAVGRSVTASYIPVLADVDQPGMRPVAQRYGIETIPTLIVADGQGKLLRRQGYLTRDGMLEFLGDASVEAH